MLLRSPRIILSLAFFAFGVPPWAGVDALSCPEILEHGTRGDSRVYVWGKGPVPPLSSMQLEFREVMKTNRGYHQQTLFRYARVFGEAFVSALSALTPEDTWTDIGLGRGHAVAEYLGAAHFSEFPLGRALSGRAKVFGVDAAKTDLRWVQDSVGEDRLRYVENQYFEDLDPAIVPLSHVMTDLYAAVSYSAAVDRVFAQGLNAILPGVGRWLFVLDAEPDLEQELSHQVIRTDDTVVSLEKWIEAIQGIRVVRASRYVWVLGRVPGKTVRIPMLDLVGYKSFYLPYVRTFRETGDFWEIGP